MKVDVKNMQGKVVGDIELPADVFEAPVNTQLMHQAYVRQMANARLGTHKTKSRGEVRGGGRKPWRQKGTGRARQGSIRSPNWVGGGKVHTPRPRDYTQKMPREMRRGALRSALSVKAADQQIVVVDNLDMAQPRTKDMLAMMGALAADSKRTLILLAERNLNVEKSANNLPDVKTLRALYLNVRDLLYYDIIIAPQDAIDVISNWLGKTELVEVEA